MSIEKIYTVDELKNIVVPMLSEFGIKKQEMKNQIEKILNTMK